MKLGAVLFPTMYDMFVAMLESWKHGYFLMIGLVSGEREEGKRGRRRKAVLRSASDGSDN